jgi:hypothetical protein
VISYNNYYSQFYHPFCELVHYRFLLLIMQFTHIPNGMNDVRFQIFTAVTMKNAVFWDVMPCGSCRNRRFGGTYRLHLPGEKNHLTKTTLAVASDRSTP